MIPGMSEALEQELRAKASDDEIARWLSPVAHYGQCELIFEKGDLRTGPMSSTQFQAMVRKGFVAVALHSEPPPELREPIDLPAEVAAYGELDLVGVWERNQDRIESSCRNGFGLLSKGWKFCGLADPDRLRAIAEARPWPPKADDTKSVPAVAEQASAPGSRRAAR